MKRLINTSLFLNAGLLAAICVVVSSGGNADKTKQMQDATAAPPKKPVQTLAKSAEAEKQSITNWSQIESEDFSTYIANLRKFGCPEATIEKIVAGEIHDIYYAKRHDLERKIDLVNQTGTFVPQSQRMALAQSLQTLQQDEKTVVTGLLHGNSAVASQSAGESSATAPPSGQVIQTSTVSGTSSASPSVRWPVAFQTPDPSTTKLPPTAQAGLAELQTNFINQIGGPNQNPQDPAYLSRWLSSQGLSDNIFRARYGYSAYNQLQLQAQQAGSNWLAK